MMKGQPFVLLLNPPHPNGQTANREGTAGLGVLADGEQRFLYPPHTLAVAAAEIRRQGIPVEILDAAGQHLSLSDTLDRIRATGPTDIGISVSWATWAHDRSVVHRLAEAFSTIRLWVIGPSTRLLVQGTEDRIPATIVAGDAELALAQLVGRPSPSPVVYSQEILPDAHTQDGFVRDLDMLPYPAWDLIDLAAYGTVSIMTSRGCTDVCAYCPYVVGQGDRFRPRHATSVVREMAWLAQHRYARRVIVRDPVFAYDAQRVVDICRGLLDQHISLEWECESRPDHLTDHLLRLMRRAGCTSVKLGLETADEGLLVRLRRVPSLEAGRAYLRHTDRVVQVGKRLGLRMRLFVMTGLPGQTEASIEQTATYLNRVQAHDVHIKPFVAYPGIRLTPEMGEPPDQSVAVAQAVTLHSALSLPHRLRRRTLLDRIRARLAQ